MPELRIPEGCPPQLRLLLEQLKKSLERPHSSMTLPYLMSSLEQLARLSAGLVMLQLSSVPPGHHLRNLDGCRAFLRAAGVNEPTVARWLEGGPPGLDVLQAWLDASEPLFRAQQFTLEQELELTLDELPPSEQHHLQPAEEALSRNLFEIAEQEFGRVWEREKLTAALTGRGRARTCLGRYDEAEQDLAGAEDARALFFRAMNRRCRGELERALEDVELALTRTLDPALLAALEMERGALQGPSGMAAYKAAVDLYEKLAQDHSTRAEVELACALVERGYLLDPTFKDYRARQTRNQAIAIFKKLKKREPLFSMDIELLRYVMERRDPWGRPANDLLTTERDLRVIRVLLELLPRTDEMVLLQKRFLELAEERLAAGPLPAGFMTQFFGLFADLASTARRGDDRSWQAEHWLRLADLFDNPDFRLRSLALACTSLQLSARLEDARRLVALLDQIGSELAEGAPPGGLELIGSAFNAVHGQMLQHPELKAEITEMAERWRALPPALPARAGVSRQVLSALGHRKVYNVEVD